MKAEILNRLTNYTTACQAFVDKLTFSVGTSVSVDLPSVEEVDEARREVMRARLALDVAKGDLKSKTDYRHTVPLLPESVKDEFWGGEFITTEQALNERGTGVELATAVLRTIERTATGGYDLWFNDDGYAFLSFENDGDAEMFVLALEGGAE